MRYRESVYLEKSLKLLERWLPESVQTMMEKYLSKPREEADWNVEEDAHGFVYCVFSWPETASERIVLLVYDDGMRIIADCSAVHCSVSDLLSSTALFDELCDESDWMYLSHYTLCAVMFPEVPYPPSGEKINAKGEALLYSNAYVTKVFRRQGIFTVMDEIMREFALRSVSGSAVLYTSFSLDPDIAVYGPDAVSTPYHYSFEKDEPDRMRNKTILEKRGFEVIRLQETEEDPDADGTKLWFAVRRENDVIIDLEKDIAA
ncbi:MAG: hypothetical protein Q4D59_09785 [Erysipelotrichaceae bacterium]|nr:hypothetical protein [Erysipelotrichaceae bacterium]